jgi:hypothetical protein
MKKQIEKMIKDMNLFPSLKLVIEDYDKAAVKLEGRENLLKTELEDLQNQHTKNYFDLEGTEDVGEIIYLQKQNKDIIYEIEVIDSLLEKVADDLTALRIEYCPRFLDAINKDKQTNNSKYNVNEIVNQYRYEMLFLIAEISKAMQSQYGEVSAAVYEVIGDKAVREVYPRLDYVFNSDHWRPTYGESMPTVISKQDVFLARDGQLSPSIPRPKGSEK